MDRIIYRKGTIELTRKEKDILMKLLHYRNNIGNHTSMTQLGKNISVPVTSLYELLHKLNGCDSLVIDEKPMMPFFYLTQRKLIYTKIRNPVLIKWF